jgi:cytochrome b561
MDAMQNVSREAVPATVYRGRLNAVRVSNDGRAPSHYDGFLIALHWATAVLVVVLYSLAQLWSFFGKPTSTELVNVHISLGMLLAGVLLLRIFWRMSFATRLPAMQAGPMELAVKFGHALLYLLLVAVVGLGFVMHWAADGQLSFFGLFSIPSPFLVNHALGHQLVFFHFWAATGLIIVAVGHAFMALFHHYVLRDGVLQRMLPVRRLHRFFRVMHEG